MQRFLLIAVAALLLAASLYWDHGRKRPAVVSGLLEADEIRVGSRVGGRVREVRVEEGSTVSVGDVLVVLEPFDLEERRAEAEALVASRRAEHQRLLAGFRTEELAQAEARRAQREADLDRLLAGPREEELGAARARLELARAEVELAQQEYERARSLHAEAIESEENVDRRSTKLKVAQATLEARAQELALLEQGTRTEDIARARAELAEADAAAELVANGYRAEDLARADAETRAAEAALAAIERRLSELTIRSPAAGAVEAINLRPGDLVAADAPVLSLLDPARLWVRAYVPENQLDLHLDQAVVITVDSYPGQRFRGRIGFIARHAEFTPRNVQTPEERSKQVFRIKVFLESGLDRLRPGMAADVWLEADAGGE